MSTVQQLLSLKGHQVWTIEPDCTVFDALELMAREDIGSLVVMEGDQFVGIVTERHYSRKIALMGRTSPNTRVRDIMETNIVVARPDQTVEECMAVMSECRIRHLPIVEGNELVGIISIGDLVKSVIANQKYTIDELVRYICS